MPSNVKLVMKGLVTVGVVALAAVVAYRHWPRESRSGLKDVIGRWVMRRMEQMMASLPEDAPPKLVMSILPRLQAQNEEIIALLRNQNEFLRERLPATAANPAA
jgi:hypothetical protein